MLKKFSFILLFILIFPVYVHADSIDFPYYFGLVTADGGTTINNGYWTENHESGYNHSFGGGGYTGSWDCDEAQAVRLLSNGAVAILYWWYNTTPGEEAWVLDDADIFRVNQDTLVYYGMYNFEDSEAELLTNPQRVKRQWKTGETFNITETIGAETVQIEITFWRKGVTLSANAVPGTSTVDDCALIHTYVYSDSSSEFEVSTGIWAPGKGELVSMNYESETDEIGADSKDMVTAWGTGSYPASMASTIEGAVTTLNTVVLSDANIVDVRPTGGTKVIVIPMN